MTIFRSIQYNLQNLRRFDGQDGKAVFLPYLMPVIYLVSIGFMLSIVPVALGVLGNSDNPGGSWIWSSLSCSLVVLVGIGLLAAAITRRLRDTGRSIIWAIPPFVLLLLAAGLMPYAFAGMLSAGAPTDLFYAMFTVNLVYLVSLAPLAFHLNRDGSSEAG
jgi:uncharacterized membrane protein YhaH (DUF805 family)